jgi:hypothetical protein
MSIAKYSSLHGDQKLCEVVTRKSMCTNLSRTYRCKHYIYINMCYNVLFFCQAVKDGIPPTQAQSYIKTHKRKDGSYPNDIVKERSVCYSSFTYCFTYMCDNLFTMHICLTHQHLIQHAGEDGDANTNRLCRIVKHDTRNDSLET